ncbi:MAG: acyl-CoA dehydrogenase family protein [Bacillota bacterium]
MEFKLGPELELLKKSVREFAQCEIAPRVDEMEKTDQVPVDVIKKMAALGFLGVAAPQKYGGTGMGNLARMILVEEVARVSAAMAMTIQCAHFGIGAVLEGGSEAIRGKYLPSLIAGDIICAAGVTESAGGSDPASNTTEAADMGDHFILNGRKTFISNSHISDIAMIVAKTKDAPQKEFTAFLVDKQMGGFRPGRVEKKIGFHGCVTGELILENCPVPRENILGREGQGLALALKGITQYGRTGIVAMSVGLIHASLDAAVKFASERVLYGKPITSLQSVQFKTAEMYADLEASRLLAYRAAWLIDQGERADLEVAAAKFFCSEAALRCTRKAMDIMGAYGCMKEFAVERYCRDAQLLVPADGTNDIMRVVAGKMVSAAVRKQ